jgi:hypothetical protein
MKADAKNYTKHLRAVLSECARTVVPLYHPLGFVSCVLPSPENGIILRVHYWPKEGRREKAPGWPVHTHNFRLSSFVMSGEIRNRNYVEIDGPGPGLERNVYKVEYEGEHSRIVDTGRVLRVEVGSDSIHSAGMGYCVERGVFHESVVPVGEMVVTLACLTEKSAIAPLVLGDVSGGSFAYQRESFDSVEFWSVVSDAVGVIE